MPIDRDATVWSSGAAIMNQILTIKLLDIADAVEQEGSNGTWSYLRQVMKSTIDL